MTSHLPHDDYSQYRWLVIPRRWSLISWHKDYSSAWCYIHIAAINPPGNHKGSPHFPQSIDDLLFKQLTGHLSHDDYSPYIWWLVISRRWSLISWHKDYSSAWCYIRISAINPPGNHKGSPHFPLSIDDLLFKQLTGHLSHDDYSPYIWWLVISRRWSLISWHKDY